MIDKEFLQLLAFIDITGFFDTRTPKSKLAFSVSVNTSLDPLN